MSTTRQGARLGVEDCGRRAEPVPPRSIALLQLFELPSPMAHALQIARTAHALVREGIEAHVFVRAGREVDVRAELASLSGHALDPGLRVHRFATRHKGLAGLRLRARSVWLAGQGVAFYGRQRRQTLDLARFVRCAERLGRRRPTVVYEFHNLDHVLAAERGDARAAARVRGEEARLLRVVDRVTAISAPLAADVEAFARASGVSLPAGGVTVIPDGVDLAAFDGVALRSIADGAPRSPLGQTGATVVYAGSLHAHKGVATLIDAFRTLPQRFALRIVGGHPPAELVALRATVEADPRLAARVSFAGLLAPSRVPAELARADLICLPGSESARAARYTSPLKLFEAMATGAPIVATAVPSITSVLRDGETAFLAPAPGAASLASAIERAASDAELAHRIGAAARERARSFGWDCRARAIAASFVTNPRP